VRRPLLHCDSSRGSACIWYLLPYNVWRRVQRLPCGRCRAALSFHFSSTAGPGPHRQRDHVPTSLCGCSVEEGPTAPAPPSDAASWLCARVPATATVLAPSNATATATAIARALLEGQGGTPLPSQRSSYNSIRRHVRNPNLTPTRLSNRQ